MQIHERVWVVGGGDNSFGMSNALDCTVYLLDGGSELALIDSGAGVDSQQIITNVTRAGFDYRRIGKIILTHGHCDHSGGAAQLAVMTGAAVVGSQLTSAFIATDPRTKLSLDAAQGSGIYPSDYQYTPSHVQTVSDEDMIHVGDIVLQLMSFPGHSDDHTGFFWTYGGKRMLFSGDLAFPKDRVSMQKTWDCRWQPYLESLRKADALHVDALFTGHQAFLLTGGHRVFQRLLQPGCAMLRNL